VIWKTIFYVSILVAFILFFILRDKGFSFRNSLLMSLFAPIVGSLFVVAGVFVGVLAGILIVFGSIAYLLNKKKIMRFSNKNFKFKVYKV
jgi:hypothetical protein